MDTILLSLTNSAPLFGKNAKKIESVTNATVEISNDNHRWVRMEYDPVYENYFIPQVQFPITEGGTYYVRASAPEYETVSASCIVPYFREVYFELVTEKHAGCVHYGEPFSELHTHYYLRWKDYAGEANYYAFHRNFDYWSYSWDPWEDIYSDSTLVNTWSVLWDENYKPCIFSDKGQDGKQLSVLLQLYYYDEDFNEITLLQTDVHSYLYLSSLENYDGDFAFFMLEPVKIYSNIKNGYGVFGAFGMRTYPLIVP